MSHSSLYILLRTFRLLDCYASYFGSLHCVAWSPDGRFILVSTIPYSKSPSDRNDQTGGQDDLVTIFSPWEQRVIARCQGHSSFVSALAFDDIRCDGRTYRFGSVGEDNKLILVSRKYVPCYIVLTVHYIKWDFSSGALHRPKLNVSASPNLYLYLSFISAAQVAHHQRMSMTSSISLALRRRGESTVFLSPPGTSGVESPLPHFHPAPSRNEVAVVQPVVVSSACPMYKSNHSYLAKPRSSIWGATR